MSASTARIARTTALVATQPGIRVGGGVGAGVGLGAGAGAARPSLRLVPAPAPHRSKVAFLMVCIAVLAAAMFSALLMNTAMAAGAYEKYDLTHQLTRVQGEQETVREELMDLSASQNLAAAAQGLGMVPSPGYAGIRLSDGVILGATAQAGGQ